MDWYRDAFYELSTSRRTGMGVGPIPWHVLDAYARRHKIGDREFDEFVTLIQAADAAYLEVVHDKKS